MNFEVLGTPNHSGPVLGLDVCLRKPLVASCSSDRSVRLWNYAERGAELVKTFQDEALALALHPSGHLLAVSANDVPACLPACLPTGSALLPSPAPLTNCPRRCRWVLPTKCGC